MAILSFIMFIRLGPGESSGQASSYASVLGQSFARLSDQDDRGRSPKRSYISIYNSPRRNLRSAAVLAAFNGGTTMLKLLATATLVVLTSMTTSIAAQEAHNA